MTVGLSGLQGITMHDVAPVLADSAYELTLIDSNDHQETLKHATGVICVGYNQGKGPFIHMFIQVTDENALLRAVGECPRQSVIQQLAAQINALLQQRTGMGTHCRSINFLSPRLPWGSCFVAAHHG